MLDLGTAKRRLDSVGELPKEHRKAALTSLCKEMTTSLLGLSCTAACSVEMIRDYKALGAKAYADLKRMK